MKLRDVKIIFLRLLLYLTFLVTVATCGPSPLPTHELTPQKIDQITGTIANPSPTSSPTVFQDPNATVEIKPTMEIITPIEPYPTDEVRNRIQDLMQTNGGCRLPCWWGITPGVTTWEEARIVLEPLTSIIAVYRTDAGEAFYVEVFYQQNPELSYYMTSRFEITKGVIQTIYVNNIEFPEEYRLSRLLNSYGEPNEVWILTYSEDNAGSPSFSTVLFYKDDGILATYFGQGEVLGDTIRACTEPGPSFSLWASTEDITFTEAAEMFWWDLEILPYLPLFEATEMEVDQFYQSFINPDSQPCLTTPIELWGPA